ncbi:cytochrome c oxidase assembly protein subunit 11 [Pseudoalteromonas ulvae UL12]|uniref:Cytochrome c oxidase assembly protein CtaG n=1 Tax=Pseudoalteromonas ulvae TaxID=107327 RepID=A0A244CVQ0_PSEDV|nr:cytochrome c oxidase assembly protein [Pseudoalteromonas ulvae]MBE0364829.1 cytochrome c oxidase assembly protein subunit 11 [Pseudoalteromonas ulvae UL12]OUL59717.1 cytochrome c oxidase assembly protein [Pseudoalteromonas ulvae]
MASLHQKLLTKLLVTCAGMFAFAFALVPLYDVFCDITGLNGKPSLEEAEQSTTVDSERLVDVGFITHIQGAAPFKVSAEAQRVTVQPGAMHKIVFKAKNMSDTDRILQAVPSVSPGLAAKYLHKIECFCFNQQPLSAGEVADLPLMFYVDTALPLKFEEITLSYTVFDISEQIQQAVTASTKETVNETRI